MFKLQQISFALPERTLLYPLDLNFTLGKVYGLIGHNGSGKSTLIKLMAKQQKLSAGQIFLNGQDINQWNSREFAKQVAYLPQQLPTNTQLTATELITMGRYAWRGLLGRYTESDKQAVAQAMALTHTQKFANQWVDTLSGGERSRIWLAMLLAQQSQFLLLDEPLAPLDIAHQVEVMQLIRQLSRELGLGVIIVIHDINLASYFCDELIALHSGRLLIQGSAKQIINAQNLQQIYGIDLNVIEHPRTACPVSFY